MYLPHFMFGYKDEWFKMWMFAVKSKLAWLHEDWLRLHDVFTLDQLEQICVQACLSNNENLYTVPEILFPVCHSAVRRQRLVTLFKYVVVGSVAYGVIRYGLSSAGRLYLDAIAFGVLTGINVSNYIRDESKLVRYLGVAVSLFSGVVVGATLIKQF